MVGHAFIHTLHLITVLYLSIYYIHNITKGIVEIIETKKAGFLSLTILQSRLATTKIERIEYIF